MGMPACFAQVGEPPRKVWPESCPGTSPWRSKFHILATIQLRSKAARLWFIAKVWKGMLEKRGARGFAGHLVVRQCSAVTAQVASASAAIVSVIPCRNETLLGASKVWMSRLGEAPGG